MGEENKSQKKDIQVETIKSKGSGPGAEPTFRINTSTTWDLESRHTKVNRDSINIIRVPSGGHILCAEMEIPLYIHGYFLIPSTYGFFPDEETMTASIDTVRSTDMEVGLKELARVALSFDSTRHNIMEALAKVENRLAEINKCNSEITKLLADEFHVEKQRPGTTAFFTAEFGRKLVLHASVGIFTTAEIKSTD